jgi:hypothetical protein
VLQTEILISWRKIPIALTGPDLGEEKAQSCENAWFCLGGTRLGGSHDGVTAVLIVLALPLWIVVSVISYKALKPKLENRE